MFFLWGKSGSDLEQWCKRYERWKCNFPLEYRYIVREIGVKNRNIYHPETACLTDIFLNSPNLLASRCAAARWENFHSALRRLRVMIEFYSLMQIWVISVPHLCVVLWVIHFCDEILCSLELPNFGLPPRLFFSMFVENWGVIFHVFPL